MLDLAACTRNACITRAGTRRVTDLVPLAGGRSTPGVGDAVGVRPASDRGQSSKSTSKSNTALSSISIESSLDSAHVCPDADIIPLAILSTAFLSLSLSPIFFFIFFFLVLLSYWYEASGREGNTSLSPALGKARIPRCMQPKRLQYRFLARRPLLYWQTRHRASGLSCVPHWQGSGTLVLSRLLRLMCPEPSSS
jgi:hypothetical protein